MAWFSPYILADGQVDTRSLDTILASPRFAGKQGEELAVALWQWLVDAKEGFYHFLAPTEEPGETLTADPVKDPLRLLNSYGYGLCGNVAMLFAGLYDWSGGRSRVVGVPGHTISEAYWGDAWHLIDCDLRAFHYKRRDKGQRTGDSQLQDECFEVASLHDLVTMPEIVGDPVRKSDPYYMSDEHARAIQKHCYEPGQERYLPHYFYRLGSTDYCLRPGESLTCYYQPQGRFYWGREWGAWIKGDQLRSFVGPKDKKDETRRYANACIRWRPNLQSDLEEVGVKCHGFEKTPVGLRAGSVAGVVRYRLVSPYVICGRYEAADPQRRRFDALLVRVNATAAPVLTIATPLDCRTGQVSLQQDGDEFFADLTEWADLHYEYELSISLPAGQTLRGIAVDTWCQASPMTLPFWYQPGRAVRLAAGSAWNDLKGRAVLSHTLDLIEELRSAAGQPAGPAQLQQGRLNDSRTHKILPQGGQVLATVAVAPPMSGKIVRLHAMAGMAAAKDPADATGQVVLEAARQPAGPWQTLDCRPVAIDPQEYHFSVEGWQVLRDPAERIWLRVRSPRPVGVWRVRVEYVPDCAERETALDVLLRWRQNGQLRMYTRRLATVEIGKAFVPVAEEGSIQPLHLVLSVPSRRGQ